jgi:hypothetical protein
MLAGTVECRLIWNTDTMKSLAVLAIFTFAFSYPQSSSIEASRSIHGVVTNSSDTPLANAKVVLRKADQAQQPEYGTLTGSGGTFLIKDVSPGRYRLFVQKDGYVAYQHGAKYPNGPGLVMVFSGNPDDRTLRIRLLSAASITGRLSDENGDPIVAAEVQVYAPRFRNGERTFVPVSAAGYLYFQTNDLGEYRIYGLSPGKYYVAATYTPNIVGSGKTLRVDQSRNSEQYVPTFFPGVTDPIGATAVDVTAGMDARGVDFTMSRARMVRVGGHLTGCAYSSLDSVDVTLSRQTAGVPQLSFHRSGRVLDKDGTFEVAGVPEGNYTLSVIVRPPNRSWTQIPVEIGGRDIDDLVVACAPRVEIRGRIRVEGETKLSFGGTDLRTRPRVDLSSLTGKQTGYTSLIQADGTFTLADFPLDHYRVTVRPLPESFYIKSISLATRDVLQEGLHLDGTSSGPLEIVLADKAASIEGIVFDDHQKAAANVMVVLVPEPRQRQRDDLYSTADTDENGGFKLQRLTPGRYELYAWESIENDYRDPEFLAKYRSRARAVVLEPGNAAAVNLTLLAPAQ